MNTKTKLMHIAHQKLLTFAAGYWSSWVRQLSIPRAYFFFAVGKFAVHSPTTSIQCVAKPELVARGKRDVSWQRTNTCGTSCTSFTTTRFSWTRINALQFLCRWVPLYGYSRNWAMKARKKTWLRQQRLPRRVLTHTLPTRVNNAPICIHSN